MPRKFIALFAQRLSVLCCVVAGGGFASLSPAAAAVAIGISSSSAGRLKARMLQRRDSRPDERRRRVPRAAVYAAVRKAA